MNKDCIEYRKYISILKEELIPAMGCTEPIAVAYCAAVARETLGAVPEKVEIFASGNIIKNVKSVVVPNTGGLRGIAAAAAAGILAGKPEKQLQVISEVAEEQKLEIDAFVQNTPIRISTTDSDLVFDLIVALSGNGHSARVRIANYHTNIVLIEKDGTVLHSAKVEEDTDDDLT
ncbi:MAG: serine dehydratase subunit alpha family protein, partial [Oscillospiraceae bacterium]|nr:serine dehydratase subunit alpha family protein [Oscillospiraceae bacterium]